MSLKDKEVINMEEKKTIAKYAASLILPGDYIFIDSGSTTEYMINYLTEKKQPKRVTIENTQAGQRYILANHDKFGLSSAVTFSDFDGTVTITDREPDDSYNVKMDIRVID